MYTGFDRMVCCCVYCGLTLNSSDIGGDPFINLFCLDLSRFQQGSSAFLYWKTGVVDRRYHSLLFYLELLVLECSLYPKVNIYVTTFSLLVHLVYFYTLSNFYFIVIVFIVQEQNYEQKDTKCAKMTKSHQR